MPTPAPRLLIADPEPYSAEVLRASLGERGYREVEVAQDETGLAAALGRGVDLVIVNHQFQRPEILGWCEAAKARLPEVPVVAVVSAGPALRAVREHAAARRTIDVVVEKPLSDERFFVVIRDLLAARAAALEQRAALERLARLVPSAALPLLGSPESGDAERFEAVVLFTDIRRSTQIVASRSPEEYFETLNVVLAAQTRAVETFRGALVKYTGDGLLAVFRGMGRSYLALRAAAALAADPVQERLGFGIGVAGGLVLGGFVGDPERRGLRRQYDVVGATVHLAARLCSRAGSGEVITTRSLAAGARLGGGRAVELGDLEVRGFDRPVACVSLRPDPAAAVPPHASPVPSP